MGFIDNVIAAVSPKKAYEREAWRQGLEAIRGYDAAGFGRINAGWRAHNESAEITDRHSRDVVRARARDLERNSDILQAVILAYKRNVVGKGYTLRAKTGDDAVNRKIESLWRRWCKARNCDVTGEQSGTPPAAWCPSNCRPSRWTNWTYHGVRRATVETASWAELNTIPGGGRWVTGSSNMTLRAGACWNRST